MSGRLCGSEGLWRCFLADLVGINGSSAISTSAARHQEEETILPEIFSSLRHVLPFSRLGHVETESTSSPRENRVPSCRETKWANHSGPFAEVYKKNKEMLKIYIKKQGRSLFFYRD
jgi:hypothetical protein